MSKNYGDTHNCGGNNKPGLVSSVGRTGGRLGAVQSKTVSMTLGAQGLSCCGGGKVLHKYVWDPIPVQYSDFAFTATIRAMDGNNNPVLTFNDTVEIVAVGEPFNSNAGDPAAGMVESITVDNLSSAPFNVTFENGVATPSIILGKQGNYVLTVKDCAGVNAGEKPCQPNVTVRGGQPSFLQIFKVTGEKVDALDHSIKMPGMRKRDHRVTDPVDVGVVEGDIKVEEHFQLYTFDRFSRRHWKGVVGVTAVPRPQTGAGGKITFTVDSDGGVTGTVQPGEGGVGYAVGDTILATSGAENVYMTVASVLNTVATATTTAAADSSRTAGTYTTLAANGAASGTGAQVTITVDAAGAVTIDSIDLAGTGYVVGETIIIDDTVLGGGGGANVELTVGSISTTVATVDGTSSSALSANTYTEVSFSSHSTSTDLTTTMTQSMISTTATAGAAGSSSIGEGMADFKFFKLTPGTVNLTFTTTLETIDEIYSPIDVQATMSLKFE
jgi:hypothetical protein